MAREKSLYDTLVVGTGSVGSATLYYLSKKGLKVAGIDRYLPPHAYGSHSGYSRLIRKSYYEGEEYVPMLEQAYEGWEELQEIRGQKFFMKTGIRYHGKESQAVMQGIRKASQTFQVPLHEGAECHPLVRPQPGYEVIHEPDAGYLLAGEAIHAYLEAAQDNGALFFSGAAVEHLEYLPEKDLVVVFFGGNRLTARRVIISAGPWLPAMDITSEEFKVTRQTILWFTPSRNTHFPESDSCWVVIPEEEQGILYGFPPAEINDKTYLKMAWHHPGAECTPETIDEFTGTDLQDFLGKASDYIDVSKIQFHHGETCLYTYSSDGHFRFPEPEKFGGRVKVATGFSGHGFKFIPFLGSELADWASE